MTAPSRDPQGLEPARPQVVRLSRRGLWALGVIVVVVAVSAVIALQAQDRRRQEQRRQGIPPPAPEARWYHQEPDALFEPASAPAPEPTPLPALTPALRLPEREPEKDPLEMRREQAYMRALDSKALVVEFQKDARVTARETLRPVPPPASGAPAALAALERLPGVPGTSPEPDDPNLQERKETFLNLDGRGEVLDSRVRPPLSRYELKAGSVIPSILVAGINSDLPGQTIAQVRENVYDTKTGAHLLLPQGTRIVGVYDSRVAYGQERVLVNWKRLIFPDGTSLSLRDGMPGADAAGFAGFSDQVDNHLFQLFGRAILLSAITAGVELSQRGFRDGDAGLGLSAADVASAALGQNLGQVATEVVRRGLDRQPTLVIRPGYRFNVMVTQDLVLPGPYADGSDHPQQKE